MATDSTELTFVRCPSCRSLVPAVYPRCRMCGATLDAAGAAPADTSPPSSSRVRQKTMTTSSSEEMNEQVERVRESIAPQTPAPPAPEAPPVSAAPVQARAEGSDPLAQYLDGEDGSDEEFLDDDDDFDDDDFVDEDTLEEDEAEVPLEETPVAPEPQPTPVAAPGAEEALMQKTLAEASKVVDELKAAEPKKEEAKPRVVVDQGKSRFGKAGLSFSMKKDERKFEAKQPEKEAASVPEKPVTPPTVHTEQSSVAEAQRPVLREVKTEVTENEAPLPTAPHERETSQPANFLMEAPMAAVQPKPVWNEKAVRDVAQKGDTLGRLYGWLVSFAEPNGSSIELREGRFFVTSQGLRENDLVFNDDTISTPHALFTVGLESGIVIQDLKSQRGVFIREKNGASYRREYDTATLNHGDWVRFGDLEFLVSVVASVGAK